MDTQEEALNQAHTPAPTPAPGSVPTPVLAHALAPAATAESRAAYFMREALKEAHAAALAGEVPIGAVVVYGEDIIARAHNRRETGADPAAHAEFLAIEEAAHKLGRWRLTGCHVFVTLEPCLMCAGLMLNARVDACSFGAWDPKAGALGSVYDLSCDPRLNHAFDVIPGILADECGDELTCFFRARRQRARE